MAQTYKNIPVKPDVYAKVQLIAELNDRGLGDQVKAWSERELPECNHKKQPVSIETFGESKDGAAAVSVMRAGLYCPSCKRVYVRAEEIS